MGGSFWFPFKTTKRGTLKTDTPTWVPPIGGSSFGEFVEYLSLPRMLVGDRFLGSTRISGIFVCPGCWTLLDRGGGNFHTQEEHRSASCGKSASVLGIPHVGHILA